MNQTGSALLLSAEELDATLPQRQLHVLVGTWNMNAKVRKASVRRWCPQRLVLTVLTSISAPWSAAECHRSSIHPRDMKFIYFSIHLRRTGDF